MNTTTPGVEKPLKKVKRLKELESPGVNNGKSQESKASLNAFDALDANMKINILPKESEEAKLLFEKSYTYWTAEEVVAASAKAFDEQRQKIVYHEVQDGFTFAKCLSLASFLKEKKSENDLLEFELPPTVELNADVLKEEVMEGLKRRWGIGVPFYDRDSKCYSFVYSLSKQGRSAVCYSNKGVGIVLVGDDYVFLPALAENSRVNSTNAHR